MATNEPRLPFVMTTTNELFLPSRIHYRVMDRAAVLANLRSLRCMNLEPCGRWSWLYESEARELGFPAAYDELPPESQPLVLASVYWIEPDRLHVYVRSTPRLGKFLEFFDRHISRRHAIAEFVDVYNVLTEQAPNRPIARPEDFFRDESKIILTDLESIASKLGGPNELARWLETQTLAPLERHPLTAFYEDGAEHMVSIARLREILAMKQRESATPIRPAEVLNDLLRPLDSSGSFAPGRQRSDSEPMAPDTSRETRANAPADTGDSSVFKFSFLESNPSCRQKIFKIASKSGSIERFTVQYDCCRNPACDCRTLDLWFQPSTDPHDAARAHDIEFSLDDRQVRCAPPTNAMKRRIAKELRARLTPEDWVRADRVYRSIKESVSDPEDAGDLDVELPKEVLSDPSVLMLYHSVFPNAGRSHFRCAGRLWFTIDRYCTRPDCDCREVVLDIAEVPESSDNETVLVKVTETATLSYNYTTGRARVKADGPANWPPALDLIAALKASDPDLDVRSQRRQRVLRQLHRSVRQDMAKSMNAQPARALKNVGRNEKCPCGSGKKYKVCCGR